MANNPQTSVTMRENNLVMLQRILLDQGPLSRAQLARLTGLSRPTVSSLISSLTDHGFISELDFEVEGAGRPGLNIDYNRQKMRLMGVELGATFIETLTTTIDGELIKKTRQEMDVRTSPQATITYLTSSLNQLIASHRAEGVLSLGVGFGLASPLTPTNPETLHDGLYPDWQGIDLGAALRSALKLPLHFENDANLGAIGAHVWGAKQGGYLSFIKLDSGIGSGHIYNGKLLRGSNGLAGEIGHLFVGSSTRACYCGQVGCLVQALGTDALSERVSKWPHTEQESSPYETLKRASTMPELAVIYEEAVEELAEHLMVALRSIIQITDPERILLGGQGGHIPKLREFTQRLLDEEQTRTPKQKIPIETTPLRESTIARGACAMVLKRASEQPLFGRNQVEVAR